MKIAYTTFYDATDIRQWSGSGYYIAKSLENQDIFIELIGSLDKNKIPKLFFKLKQNIYRYLLQKNYLLHREPLLIKQYTQKLNNRLSNLKADIIFSSGTLPIAYLDSNLPKVFWTDATFSGMIDFYPEFTNICQESFENGNYIEKLALERCSLAIYSSDWAAKTAIDSYNIDPSKVKVVPFGANIECNRTTDEIQELVKLRPSNKCKLLFLGVDWFRKGGDIAFEVAKELNKQGLPTELTVIGCKPIIKGVLPDFVKPLGFISKDSKEGLQKINRLISESHFLILPSRAECFGIVFCEANSFGVPCLGSNVGGVSTIIRDGLNGKTFSKKATIAEYCTYILKFFSNHYQYNELALSSFNEYQSRLNWAVNGKVVKNLMMELI